MIHPDALTWVIVGDLSKIEAPVRALNLGEVHVIDADGNPAKDVSHARTGKATKATKASKPAQDAARPGAPASNSREGAIEEDRALTAVRLA